MAAVIVEIADAVKSVLDGASLSQSFTSVRSYAPLFGKQDEDSDDLEELQLVVVPRELSAAQLTRRSSMFDYVVDVGICQRKALTNADIDPLMVFTEEVVDLFRSKPLTGYTSAYCTAVANNPIYDFASLTQQKTFLSLVTLTFQKARDVA